MENKLRTFSAASFALTHFAIAGSFAVALLLTEGDAAGASYHA
jgi:uncharacterized membrane protein